MGGVICIQFGVALHTGSFLVWPEATRIRDDIEKWQALRKCVPSNCFLTFSGALPNENKFIMKMSVNKGY